MFFAWAIGGEKYFGRYRRGMLLAIPMTIAAIVFKTHWTLIIAQFAVLYAVYQSLRYDEGINMIYKETGNYKWAMGWGIVAANGAIIGLTPICMLIMTKAGMMKIIFSILASTLAFCFAVMLSNDEQFKDYRDWLNKHMPNIPWLNFKDSWYVSEGLVGVVLAVIVTICMLIK
jgi:hypothetical protein